MTSPSQYPGMPDEPTPRQMMYLGLLSGSSVLYAKDPLFFSRVQIALAATMFGSEITGIKMTNDAFAIATQAACVALSLSLVSDEELSASIDHGKVMVGMLEYSLVNEQLFGKKDDEEEE